MSSLLLDFEDEQKSKRSKYDFTKLPKSLNSYKTKIFGGQNYEHF